LALAIAYGLKRYYSTAAAEDLRWILGPTAALVGAVSGKAFLYEAGGGYVNRELLFAIAPSCAGVNFLIISSCSLLCVLAPAYRGRRRVLLIAGAMGAAYAWTLAANTARILLAMALPGGEATHRAQGIIVYLCFLLLLHARIGRFSVIPLAWYWGVMLAVPLLRGAGGPKFYAHAAMTLVAGGAALLISARQHAADKSPRPIGG